MGLGQVLGVHRVLPGLVEDILDNLMDVLEVLVLHSCFRKMDLLVEDLLVGHEEVLLEGHEVVL